MTRPGGSAPRRAAPRSARAPSGPTRPPRPPRATRATTWAAGPSEATAAWATWPSEATAARPTGAAEAASSTRSARAAEPAAVPGGKCRRFLDPDVGRRVAGALEADLDVIAGLGSLDLAPPRAQQMPKPAGGGLADVVGPRHLHVQVLVPDFLAISHVRQRVAGTKRGGPGGSPPHFVRPVARYGVSTTGMEITLMGRPSSALDSNTSTMPSCSRSTAYARSCW